MVIPLYEVDHFGNIIHSNFNVCGEKSGEINPSSRVWGDIEYHNKVQSYNLLITIQKFRNRSIKCKSFKAANFTSMVNFCK